MKLNELITTRRSIRKYQNKPLDRDALDAVLEAGRLAPSARNRQDWHFTAVENPALRQQLADACCNQQMVSDAPVALVIWMNAEDVMRCDQSAATIDGAIALSFMMLKATELGLGTCWLGAFYADKVKAALALPNDAIVVAVSPLGWPDESPAPRPRKSAKEVVDYRV